MSNPSDRDRSRNPRVQAGMLWAHDVLGRATASEEASSNEADVVGTETSRTLHRPLEAMSDPRKPTGADRQSPSQDTALSERPAFARPRVISPRVRMPVARLSTFEAEEPPPEPFATAEPLRISLPSTPEEEASLVLAAGDFDDYPDDEDDEDDWMEDGDAAVEGNSIRLTLSTDAEPLDDLRNLEERRSFAEPVWAPRPQGQGFDNDISLFDESDDDDEDMLESPSARAARLARESIFASHDDVELGVFDQLHEPSFGGRPQVAAVQLGSSEPFFRTTLSDTPETQDARNDDGNWGDEVDTVASMSPMAVETNPARTSPDLGEEEPPDDHNDGGVDAVQSRSLPGAPAKTASEEGLLWQMAFTVVLVLLGWAGFVTLDSRPLSTPTETVVSEQPVDAAPVSSKPDPVQSTTAPATPPASVDPVLQPTSVAPPAPPIGLPPMEADVIAERMEPTVGELRIESDRPARVYLEGRNLGTTPLPPQSLAAGEYALKLVDVQTGRVQQVQARVDAGKVSLVALSFQP